MRHLEPPWSQVLVGRKLRCFRRSPTTRMRLITATKGGIRSNFCGLAAASFSLPFPFSTAFGFSTDFLGAAPFLRDFSSSSSETSDLEYIVIRQVTAYQNRRHPFPVSLV